MNATPEKYSRASRRAFLKVGVVIGGSLIVGIPLFDAAAEGDEAFLPNAFLKLEENGRITLSLPKSEMGQGVYTSLAMLVAEELEIDVAQLIIELPPGATPKDGAMTQGTGGSTSIRETWMPLRQASADTRMALIQAAARRWNVPASDCKAEKAIVWHPSSNKKLTYAELVRDAAAAPLPQNTPLKASDTFRVIGRPQRRLDSRPKVNGTAIYGIDVIRPNMKIGTLAQSPVPGGRLGKINEVAAMAVSGVSKVVRMDDAVAVIGNSYWTAKKGLDALEIEWIDGPNASMNQESLRQAQMQAFMGTGKLASDTGQSADKRKGENNPANSRVTAATYTQPFLAHAAMEPANCVAHWQPHSCEVWTGTQIPDTARVLVAKLTGLPIERVTIHNFLLGGAFGRRLQADMITRTVEVARHCDGPVKLIWSREEDIRQDHFRPIYRDMVKASIDPSGKPAIWDHRICGPSLMALSTAVGFQASVAE
ncbi:MAG: xanthine dehydrogenase family protein molybdopterin-binding subunit [Sphingomonadaceae bacterium]|nr:xanthine dehydrogenase family protein molybdopterin-binding subunit [Sphingomonadaceae bacterium]